MNLSQIRGKVQSLTNFKADNPAHLADLDDIINRAQTYVCEAHRWTWAQKTVFLDVVPDLDNTLTGATCALFNFSRQVDFSADIHSVLPPLWVDQYLELNSRDYKISKIEEGLGYTRVILDEPYRGAPVAAYTGWVLKKKFYTLPEDLVEILSVAHTDSPIRGAQRREIPCIPTRVDELTSLEDQRTADYADLYSYGSPAWVPPGEKLGDLEEPQGYPDSALVPGDEYELCWTFERNGRLGALSDPKVYTVLEGLQDSVVGPSGTLLTHDDTIVKCLPFDPTQDRYKAAFEGLRKVLFVNVNYRRRADTLGNPAGRLGLPRWVIVTRAGSETVRTEESVKPLYILDDAATFEIGYAAQMSPGNTPYVEVDGHHQQIRFYPRIIGFDVKYLYAEVSSPETTTYVPEVYFRRIELRYRYKLPALVQTTDSPEMPFEMHELIVTKAVADYYMKIGEPNLSQVYESRFDRDLKSFASRYTSNQSTVWQRPLQFGGGNPVVNRLNSVRLRN